MCNLSWWVPCVDQPQKHNPSQWLGAMPINVFLLLFTKWNVLFCAEFTDAYIFKTTNNVNVYSVWVRFFSATLQENKTTCGHFNWYKIKHNNFTDSAMIWPCQKHETANKNWNWGEGGGVWGRKYNGVHWPTHTYIPVTIKKIPTTC